MHKHYFFFFIERKEQEEQRKERKAEEAFEEEVKEELARRVEGRKTRKEMGSRWTRGPLILGPCFAEAEWNTRFFERMVSNTCEGPLGEG